jgi:hypothetical protein
MIGPACEPKCEFHNSQERKKEGNCAYSKTPFQTLTERIRIDFRSCEEGPQTSAKCRKKTDQLI